jgi:hypothetical protein
MKRLLAIALLSAALSNAGVVKVVTYPVRHPIKLVKKTGHVAWKIVW